MAKRVRKAIVNCSDYNGHKNVLFLMREDDFRFNDGDYTPIEYGTMDKQKIFHGEKGGEYKIFPDWSAKKLSQN